jgi:hypothetical protein
MKKQVSHSIFFYYICGKLIFMNMKESIETQIIEEKDIIEITPDQVEQPEKECKTCKQKKITNGQLAMLISSFYILFSSIYGTIKLIKELINYLQ